MKPWYFECDCPFCTRSAACFCFKTSLLSSTCYVGEMMTPCQLSTFSEFICTAFQFQGPIAQKKSVNGWKITNEVKKGWKSMMWLRMVHFEHRKTRSSNKFKKMTSLCNTRVSVWNPDTSNEIFRFVHEVHPVFLRKPLYFLAQAMRVKWWHHANFQPFQSSFVVLFNFRVL